MEKKKKPGLIIGIIIAICFTMLIVGLVVYASLKPMLILKNKMDEIVNKTYKYSLDAKIEGYEIKYLGNEFSGRISGKKGNETIFGELFYDDTKYVELYADKSLNMVFNCKPFFVSMLDTVGEKTGLPVNLISFMVTDLNISLEQIESIVGVDIVTLSDSGVTSDLFKSISGNKSKKNNFTINVIKKTEKKDILLEDKEAYYFRINLSDNDTEIIIGIPKKEENKIVARIYYGNIIWNFMMEYDICDVEDVVIPEKTISDKVIETIKSVYQLWIEQEIK